VEFRSSFFQKLEESDREEQKPVRDEIECIWNAGRDCGVGDVAQSKAHVVVGKAGFEAEFDGEAAGGAGARSA
jgi:hypothetical protein